MKTQSKGFSALGFMAMTLVIGMMFSHRPDRSWIQGMILVAASEGVLGFWLTGLAMRGSDRFFYSVALGRMLCRLFLLGAAAYLLHQWSSSIAAPLLTLVCGYFLCSMAQMPFLIRMNQWIS